MARHAIPVGEEHDCTLTCPCRPRLGFLVVAGSRVPVVRHRRWTEVACTATTARPDPVTDSEGGDGS